MRFEDLVGQECGAVHFVRDYVELNFDGPIFRSLTNCAVVLHGREVRFPGPGSRDALCELIGRTVEGADETDDDLVLAFEGNARFLSPKRIDVPQPEVAHLVPMKAGRRDPAEMSIWMNQMEAEGD